MLRIGVLASGRGSNFQAIIDEIEAGSLPAKIEILIVDNPEAYAIKRAEKHKIPYLYINPEDFPTKEAFYEKIRDELILREVELVVLAGFMRIVKKPLLDAFPMRIINIHPALLPSFPGLHAQKQAVDYGVKISGCTVHFVDEGVDSGPVIIQAALPVHPDDSEDTLSERILKLEHKILPEAIRLFAQGKLRIEGRKVKILNYSLPNKYFANPEIER